MARPRHVIEKEIRQAMLEMVAEGIVVLYCDVQLKSESIAYAEIADAGLLNAKVVCDG